MSVKIDREYTFIDKSDWGDGPWQAEPDKQQWIDEATDLDCLLVRNPWSGHLCGYVGVPEGHPLFGLHYTDADDHAEPDEDGFREFKVHGGLTFAGLCQEGGEEAGICHVPAPGRPDRIHWFGFDAMHAWDIGPATEALLWRLAASAALDPSGSWLSTRWRNSAVSLSSRSGECTALFRMTDCAYLRSASSSSGVRSLPV